MQSSSRDLEGAMGDVDTQNLPEGRLLYQRLKQETFTASEVDHAMSPALSEHDHDGADALVPEPDPILQRLLVITPRFLALLERRIVLLDELGQGPPHERGETEIAPRDDLPFRVIGQPTFSVAKKLVDLGIADPVVLLGVRRGNENKKVGKQL